MVLSMYFRYLSVKKFNYLIIILILIFLESKIFYIRILDIEIMTLHPCHALITLTFVIQ